MIQAIGLVGQRCAGKGEVATILTRMGYTSLTLSDRLREDLSDKGVPVTTELLIVRANELRLQEGNDVLMKRTLALIRDQGIQYPVIDGIRNPAEISCLRETAIGEGFTTTITAIEASHETRYRRLLARNREGSLTRAEFMDQYARENPTNEDTAHKQQLSLCMAMADISVENDTDDPRVLEDRVYELLRTVGHEGSLHPREKK